MVTMSDQQEALGDATTAATSRITAVHPLFAVRGPSAVFRRVRTIVVNAVKRQRLWCFTHVAEEGREVVAPRIAHHNTPGTVVLESNVVRVVAAIFCVAPRQIRLREAAFRMMAVSVTCAALAGFGFQAATASRVASNEIVFQGNRLVAAVARAQPLNLEPFMRRLSRSIWTPLHDEQAAESLTSQVLEGKRHV